MGRVKFTEDYVREVMSYHNENGRAATLSRFNISSGALSRIIAKSGDTPPSEQKLFFRVAMDGIVAAHPNATVAEYKRLLEEKAKLTGYVVPSRVWITDELKRRQLKK